MNRHIKKKSLSKSKSQPLREGLILGLTIFILLFLSMNVKADDLPRNSVTCDSTVGAPFTCSAAKDNDVGTRWVSTPGYPHYINLSFGASFFVTSVALNQDCLEYSATGKVFAGGNQVGSWSGGTSTNLTISITETYSDYVKFQMDTDHGGGFGYACAVEVWAFGHSLAPPTVTTLSFQDVTCNSAQINGNLTNLGTSNPVEVGFLYGKDPALIGATNISVANETNATTFSLILTELEEDSVYYFQAWANGTDGFDNGSILYFTTDICPVFCSPSFSNLNLFIFLMFGVMTLVTFLIGLYERFFLFLSGFIMLFFSFEVFVISCDILVTTLTFVVTIFVFIFGMGRRPRK